MNAQTVSDELRRWILAQAEAGGRPQELLAAMVRSGWDEELAAEALVQELTARLAQLQHRQQREALPPAAAVPNRRRAPPCRPADASFRCWRR